MAPLGASFRSHQHPALGHSAMPSSEMDDGTSTTDDATPRSSHILSFQHTNTAEVPTTPPSASRSGAHHLPTPTSHHDFNSFDQPMPGAALGSETSSEADVSPTTAVAEVAARKAKHRSSAEVAPGWLGRPSSSSALEGVISRNTSELLKASERREADLSALRARSASPSKADAVTASHHARKSSRGRRTSGSEGPTRGRDRGYSDDDEARSPTPSPILGPLQGDQGHLSFPGLGPSAADIKALLDSPGRVASTSQSAQPLQRTDVEGMLSKLESMSVSDTKLRTDGSGGAPESELVEMAKKLAAHVIEQEDYQTSLDAVVQSVRVNALSVIASMTTAHARELASERDLRSRLEAELDGAKSQARMLSAMLARSNAKLERAGSVDEDYAAAWLSSARGRTHPEQGAGMAMQDKGKARDGESAVQSNPQSVEVLQEPIELVAESGSPKYAHDGGEADGGILGLGITGSGMNGMDVEDSPLPAIVRERNKLLADKRYLKNRVRDSEAQLHRLEGELRSLRSVLLRGAPKVVGDNQAAPSKDAIPTTPSRSHRRDRKGRRRVVTMGDAEAEHLLLAARRLREVRRDHTSNDRGSGGAVQSAAFSPTKRPLQDGRFLADEDAAHTNEDAPATPRTPSRRTEKTPRTPRSGANAILGATPRSNRRGVNDSTVEEDGGSPRKGWPSHERVDSAMSSQSFANGMDELLQAAQTVLTRPTTPNSSEPPYYPRLPGPPTHESPKRRRVSSAAVVLDGRRPREAEDAVEVLTAAPRSPEKGWRRTRTATEGDSNEQQSAVSFGMGLSALDLLADQAAASQNPSQSSDRSGSGSAEAMARPSSSSEHSLSGLDETMRMDEDGRAVFAGKGRPAQANGRVRAEEDALLSSSPSAPSQYASANATALQSTPRGSAVAGQTNTASPTPEKRLPYVRWTADEDTKLRKAIKEHGQRWELVSRAVKTRSYHQCRQRYLLMRRKEAEAAAAEAAATDGEGVSPPLTPSKASRKAGAAAAAA